MTLPFAEEVRSTMNISPLCDTIARRSLRQTVEVAQGHTAHIDHRLKDGS